MSTERFSIIDHDGRPALVTDVEPDGTTRLRVFATAPGQPDEFVTIAPGPVAQYNADLMAAAQPAPVEPAAQPPAAAFVPPAPPSLPGFIQPPPVDSGIGPAAF